MKMKSYPTFDAYLADQPAANQALIKKLRAFVKRTAPQLQESVKYGNGCWLGTSGKPLVYVYAAEDHTQFGFIAGARFADPAGLLEGNGKWVRFVKLKSAADFDAAAFAGLVAEAVAAGHPADAVKKKAARPARAAPAKRKR